MNEFDVVDEIDQHTWFNVSRLIRRGWELKGDWWQHKRHVNQGLPLLFTIDQALKAEGLS